MSIGLAKLRELFLGSALFELSILPKKPNSLYISIYSNKTINSISHNISVLFRQVFNEFKAN